MNEGKKDFNMAVTLSRIVAMCMIIICHLGSATGKSAIGQLFSTGVQVFLFISGYLYSTKKIDSAKAWLKGRFIRICVPCYLFISGSIIVSLCLKAGFSWIMPILCVFNLEGYHHIFNEMYYIPAIPGTAHLWFITALWICYLLTIAVKRKPGLIKPLMIFLSAGIILGLFGIRLDYFWIYFVGYLYGKSGKKSGKKKYVMICLAAAMAGMLRLLMKGYCDTYGENNLYLYMVIPFVYNILAIWIFITIEKLADIRIIAVALKKPFIKKAVLWMEGISFYVFITHYIFIDGPLRILGLSPYSFLNVILLMAAMTVASLMLRKISTKLGEHVYGRIG